MGGGPYKDQVRVSFFCEIPSILAIFSILLRLMFFLDKVIFIGDNYPENKSL
jgi:hypothetical protein